VFSIFNASKFIKEIFRKKNTKPPSVFLSLNWILILLLAGCGAGPEISDDPAATTSSAQQISSRSSQNNQTTSAVSSSSDLTTSSSSQSTPLVSSSASSSYQSSSLINVMSSINSVASSSSIVSSISSNIKSSSSSKSSSNSINSSSSSKSSSFSSSSFSSVSSIANLSSSSKSSSASSSSVADIAAGKALYETNCIACHGSNGNGAYKIDSLKSTYSYKSGAAQSLEAFITDWMPDGNPTACIGSCAINIAAYIRSWDLPVTSSSISSNSISSSKSSSLSSVSSSSRSSSVSISSSSRISSSSSSRSSSNSLSSSSRSSSVAVGNAINGKTLYDANCSGCHGTSGNGLYKINPSKSAYSYKSGIAQTLETYINDWMPEGNPTQCTGQCALDTASYIRSWGSSSSSSSGSIEPLPMSSALRKIKNVLTGLAPTEQEFAVAKTNADLALLVEDWMETPEFKEKMIFFFANAFQQSSISIEDFYGQLRNRPGAFNLSYGIYGDMAMPTLFKNMNESIARTAMHFVETGRPLSDLLTTDEFMMTTALKSVYMQIEANRDTASDANVMKWRFNYGRRPALENTLNPNHADFMLFGHENATTITAGRKFTDSCNGNTGLVSQFPGNVHLFHLMLGHVGRDTGSGPGTTATGCWERATKPYFSPTDLSDWKLVKIVRGTRIEPWNLIALRASGNTLPSVAPRIGFFTTPAFLAVWNTNNSNAHRVTVNQSLLVALGQGFSSADQAIPIPPNTAAVDGAHAVDSSECFSCHKSLDPMRQFFENWYFSSDKPKGGTGTGPQPSFGFGNVTGSGRTLVEFGNFIKQVTDEVAGDRVNRFALAFTQKLCYFGNSAKCEEDDPEMRRIAHEFEDSNYNFKVLVKELFSSPLMTASQSTTTFARNGVTISITRRDQLCQALSNRLGIADICKINLPLRSSLSRVGLLAGALPYDSFSRGVPEPVTPTDPNIFYRGASELLCESIATSVVDSTTNPVFSSGNLDAALELMVSKVMGLPPADPKRAAALNILRAHNTAALTAGATKTNALRSTFSAACQSPSSLAIGI
jgi:mono/diheme cytochrome c family protein